MHKLVEELIGKASETIIGKQAQIELSLCCYFSGGHLLIEDTPGVGKTTLAKTLATLFSHDFKRIQFTNDLLPSDLIGVQIFNPKEQNFNFHKGPIFTQILLGDELNRASPKTQSALLQAMEEHKVTVEGTTHELPSPFFVVATQNPKGQLGTYPLPESQIDRFMMKISLGPPTPEEEAKLLINNQNYQVNENQFNNDNQNQIDGIFSGRKAVMLDEKLAAYVVELLNKSRIDESFMDLSPRSGIDLIEASKTYAFFKERDHVTPDDIQFLIPFIWGHRLISPVEASIVSERNLAEKLIQSVTVP